MAARSGQMGAPAVRSPAARLGEAKQMPRRETTRMAELGETGEGTELRQRRPWLMKGLGTGHPGQDPAGLGGGRHKDDRECRRACSCVHDGTFCSSKTTGADDLREKPRETVGGGREARGGTGPTGARGRGSWSSTKMARRTFTPPGRRGGDTRAAARKMVRWGELDGRMVASCSNLDDAESMGVGRRLRWRLAVRWMGIQRWSLRRWLEGEGSGRIPMKM